MKSILSLLVVVQLMLFSAMNVQAEKNTLEIDYLSLAELLIQDGNYDRASAALNEVRFDDPKVDLAKYYSVLGRLFYFTSSFGDAQKAYIQAIKKITVEDRYQTSRFPEQLRDEDLLVFIYAAQTEYALENYQSAIDFIKRSEHVGEKLVFSYTLRAQCHWKLKQFDNTWSVLDQGQVAFPANNKFMRQKIFYLIELGLFQKASEMSIAYLDKFKPETKEYVALGRALKEAGDLDRAALILEKAKLEYPEDVAIMIELAAVYIERDQPVAAADLFAQATIYSPQLVADTAELYRQAGRLYQALNMNAEILDQKGKLKQRLAILIELERFEMVSAMGEALYRTGLLQDQDIAYAYAYALFKTGDFEQAREQLDSLKRPDLFRKATELRKAMDECHNATWKCY